ncbi:MAG: YitT family protein [Vicingus serpentipes]|nr:YitT family protein [Vicingus serpentipes]
MIQIKKSQQFINYLFTVLGSFVLAFGMVGFLIPNKIATGGTAGLATIFHYLFNLPTGIMMAIINAPLLLVSVKYLGRQFATKSIMCIVLTVVFIDVLAEIVCLSSLSDDLLLATLYGGAAVGVGLGLIFKGGASAGGATIIAQILVAKLEVKTSYVILVLDAIVVVLASIVFKSIELALWSMISIFVATKMIDLILTGRATEKIVHISSSKELRTLANMLRHELGISGTIVKGEDISLVGHKDIIFILIDKNRLSTLKQFVLAYDDQAKMIVSEATEVLRPSVKEKI